MASADVSTAAAERAVTAAVRRHKTRETALEQAATDRDETIREAIAAGVPRARLVALTGLSKQRVDQIRRGARL